MKRKIGHKSELVLLVGLLVAFFWNIQGKSCIQQSDCQPDIECRIIPWSCNGSDYVPATPAPTVDPSTQRCCVHLDTCGGEVEVAGWINVRNTTVQLDGIQYVAEWLDTFVTEGNATEPSVIKSAYVGSWNTLKEASIAYPSQMFVAEPTNSCSVDGEPKWPEWYQVTANIIANNLTDNTLDVESFRDKDCLCDVEWDCLWNLCHVATLEMSNREANLSKTNTDIESKVADFCRFSDYVNVSNYSASSYFAVGFLPSMSELDTFNFSQSVEGGWGPDLDDTSPWFEFQLAEDTMISGIETQGVAMNPERRVDEFTVEYEASSDPGPTTIASSKVFKAGARLDTKMINSFPVPVKANRVKLMIQKPCDAYYVGMRVGLVGCTPCATDGECTLRDGGVCEPEKFCTYIVPTTLEPTTEPPTTVMSTAAVLTRAGSTAGATTSPTTTGPSARATSTASTAQTNGQFTSMPTSNVISNPPAATTTDATATTTGTTVAPTVAPATSAHMPSISDTILGKIEELNLPPEEALALFGVLEGSNGSTISVDVKVTPGFIKAGLAVIHNITIDANTTNDQDLQIQIILGAWNFLAIVSTSTLFTDSESGSELFNQYLAVADLILDEDREEAWKEVQKETVAGPMTIVMSLEDVAIKIANHSTRNADITIKEENIEGIITGITLDKLTHDGFGYSFASKDPNPELEETSVTVSSEALKSFNLPSNTNLTLVVLRLNITSVYQSDNASQRLGSPVISITIVADGQVYSIPVDFFLLHKPVYRNETQHCSYWEKDPQNRAKGEWSTKGCTTSNQMAKSTSCSCSHTTNYAVLMWLGPEPMEENSTLETITTVGCLVSIIALVVALCLLAYLKSSLSSERIIIHMHLMGVTLVALVLFLAGSDKTENKPLCLFITIALHFFYMSMFSWMLVEGIHLYRQIIAVFESGKSRLWLYFVIGWGIPVLVVGITTGIFFDKYSTHELCWLDVKDGSLWAFIGPMIPICLVNLVVLFMVCRIVVSAAKLQQEKPGFNSAKAGVRSSLLLLPILGVTWVFGYFSAVTPVMMYIFVVLNSFQGFFMALFHCFMSSEVNTALKQKIRKVKDSSIGGASSMDSTSKPPMFTSGMRKVKVSPSMTDQTDDY